MSDSEAVHKVSVDDVHVGEAGSAQPHAHDSVGREPAASNADVRLALIPEAGERGTSVPSPSAPALSPSPGEKHFVHASTFRVTCGVTSFWMLTVFSIAVAALALAVRLYRPDVYLSASAASSTAGYTYGGAVHAGSGMWVTNKPRLPSPRSDLCAVTIADVIYLLGGVNSSNAVLSDVLAFDAVTETYNSSLLRMPAPRYRFAAAAIGARIYAVGGITVYNGDPVATMDVYDTVRNVWSSAPAGMSVARTDLAVAAVNGKLYVVGGYGVGYDMSVTGRLLEVFDPATGAWTVLPRMLTSRGDLVAVAYKSRLYAFGGWRDDDTVNGVGGDFQAAAEVYDPATNRWSPLANMLTRKGDSAVTVYRSTIVSVGGEVWSGRFAPCDWDPSQTCKVNQVPTHDCVSFLPDAEPATRAEFTGAGGLISNAGVNGAPGVWISHAPMPGARFRFAAASSDVAQAVFVFGGATFGGLTDAVTAFYDTAHPRVFMHYRDGSTWW